MSASVGNHGDTAQSGIWTGDQTVPTDSASGEATPDQPVAARNRIVSLDFIRGVAVLGILFANITAFAHPMIAYSWPAGLPGGGSWSDALIWLLQFVAVDGKFRGLFTLLFGAGMMLFMERVWQRGGTAWLQARRLFWLALFGLSHFYLLFIGDILFLYAISGFLALGMLRWSAGTQLWAGLIWYLFGSLIFAASLGVQAGMEASPQMQSQAAEEWQVIEEGWTAQMRDAQAEEAVMREGSYGDILSYRVAEQSGELSFFFVLAVLETVPLMLIGMALYRFGLFEGRPDRGRMRLWGWVGVLGGGGASLALGYWVLASGFPPFLTQFASNGAATFFRLPMILGLAALLTLLAVQAQNGWLGERLVAAGRMAFTNYIAMSIVMTLVFHGWAGGLYGELNRLELLLIVALGWALMIAWSRPWVARYRYGPLEYLWRGLTYWRIFSLRR